MELLDPTAPLPWLTADLPGTGGVIKDRPEDFEVEEILGRRPSGQGEHLYLFVEKRDLSADAMMGQIARDLGIERKLVCAAGLKDARAVTRQWISVPGSCEPNLGQLSEDRLRILDSDRDRSKLRAGQLEGNRFNILIRDSVPEARARADAICRRLLADGFPNFYGHQRFGRDGHTSRLGLDLLAGGESTSIRGGFHKKLALSAAQSLLFNTWLVARCRDELLYRAITGEIIQSRKTALPAWVMDVDAAQKKLDARQAVPMGPMFGPRMRPAKHAAADRERAVLEAAGLTADSFAAFGRLCGGTRRPALVWLRGIEVTADPAGLRLRFELPAGCYATVLLGELTKEMV